MKTNIILLMTDQQRWDSLGCYGNKIVLTPNIDNLAKDGLIYHNAYSTCPVCVPARGCLLTGLNEFNLGTLTYSAALKPSYKTTLPQLLKKEGYQTTAVGKNHFSPQRAKHGYDKVILDESGRIESEDFISDYMSWFKQETGSDKIIDANFDFNGYNGGAFPHEERLHPTSWTRDTAINEIRNYDSKKPFFLKVSFARPHSPYDPPSRWFDYYNHIDLPMPVITHNDKKFEMRLGGKTKWRGKSSPQENQNTRSGYYGNVSFIDEAVGKIISELKTQNLYDNSLIIYLSDHGDMLGDHNLWRKSYAYEGSSHIPLIMKPPKNYACDNFDLNTPAALYDILPTVMNIVNPNASFYSDGINLLKNSREYVFGEYILGYSRKMDMQYICDGNYKFIWYLRRGTFELYDLQNDRYECNNLAYVSEYSNTVAKYCSIIKSEMKSKNIDVTGKGKFGFKRYLFQLPYDKYGQPRTR